MASSQRVLARVALAFVATTAAVAQDGAQVAAPETPWPIALGHRTVGFERAWPVVDQVVLVPDERTYLDELSRWSEKGRWPVLIEDGFFAPLFVRGFAPARVVRRASVGAMPADTAEREALIARCVAEAVADGAATLAEAAAKRSWTPSMVVLANAADPAWTAAAALSAGRGAPIRFTGREPRNYAGPSDTLDLDAFRRLSSELERAADTTGLPWKGLGDAIDAFVVCQDVALKSAPAMPASEQVTVAQGPLPTRAGDPVSTVNALARHADGVPWAIGGAIFGDARRSAYVAMCSLFMPRRTAWMFDTYDDGGGWKDYSLETAVPVLERQGFVVRRWSREQSTLTAWRPVLMGGFDCDALFVNSHGMPFEFGLASGTTANGGDVPHFDRPAIVHFLHSFSLNTPDNPDSVGGRFLEHGAYAYHGSVLEPYLVGFVPPKSIVERTGFVIPFLLASRVYEGPFARPWRTMGYGDPLCVFGPAEKMLLPRVPAPEDGTAALRESAAKALARFRDAKDAAALAEAARDLSLSGDDEKVRAVWALAKPTDAAPEVARHALGALFRKRDLTAFAEAFARVDTPTLSEKDMLWHLAMPRLGSFDDARVLALLGRNLRGWDPTNDLKTLKDAAVRVLGARAWQSVCDGAAARITDAGVKAKVDGLR
ncbi:MAG: hypothetical protein LW636_06040 [Planctomycetaceae bacterium]|nr:hypothetical protein [Planctomycetaceae bacterium]